MAIKLLYKKVDLNDKTILAGAWLVYLLNVFVRAHYDYIDLFIEALFTLNYIIAIIVIAYVFVPKFLYKERHILFLVSSFITLLLVAYIEETFLEHLFYHTTRAQDQVTIQSLIGTIPEFLLYIIAFTSFKLAWDHQEKQKAISRLEKEKYESELKFLKSQLNPHILFNNLNNIYSFALHQSNKTPDMLLKLSGIMRYVLYEGNEIAVPLKKELNFLNDYIALQQVALEGRGQLSYTQKGDPAGYYIEPLILISIIENCFKHSLDSTLKAIEITINIGIEEGVFTLYTQNPSIPKESRKASWLDIGGIGLENVRRRLQLIYPGKHSLTIDLSKDLFTVNLSIQLL